MEGFFFVRNVDETPCKGCEQIHEFWTKGCVPVAIDPDLSNVADEDKQVKIPIFKPSRKTVMVGEGLDE